MTRRDTSFHSRLLAAQMKDPEFKDEYDRARAEIAQVDSVIRQLDEMREAAGISKAELARRIGRNASSIRRLFSASANPELLLVASIAADLDAELKVVQTKKTKKSTTSSRQKSSRRASGRLAAA
jgi:ribosome-binding protein aMBF1 (putative translation factor)